MKTIARTAGLIITLLGGLWLLQGLGIIHLRPILCFADCAPVQEASVTWAVIGGVAIVVGILMMRRSRGGLDRPV